MMKGVVFSTSFFIMIFAVFLNLSNYVHFDHNRAIINNTFKKSMQQLAIKLNEMEDFQLDDVLIIHREIIEQSLPKDFEYDIHLLGLSNDPLLLRIKLISKSKVSFHKFELEETIVEKGMKEDEFQEK